MLRKHRASDNASSLSLSHFHTQNLPLSSQSTLIIPAIGRLVIRLFMYINIAFLCLLFWCLSQRDFEKQPITFLVYFFIGLISCFVDLTVLSNEITVKVPLLIALFSIKHAAILAVVASAATEDDFIESNSETSKNSPDFTSVWVLAVYGITTELARRLHAPAIPFTIFYQLLLFVISQDFSLLSFCVLTVSCLLVSIIWQTDFSVDQMLKRLVVVQQQQQQQQQTKQIHSQVESQRSSLVRFYCRVLFNPEPPTEEQQEQQTQQQKQLQRRLSQRESHAAAAAAAVDEKSERGRKDKEETNNHDKLDKVLVSETLKLRKMTSEILVSTAVQPSNGNEKDNETATYRLKETAGLLHTSEICSCHCHKIYQADPNYIKYGTLNTANTLGDKPSQLASTNIPSNFYLNPTSIVMNQSTALPFKSKSSLKFMGNLSQTIREDLGVQSLWLGDPPPSRKRDSKSSNNTFSRKFESIISKQMQLQKQSSLHLQHLKRLQLSRFVPFEFIVARRAKGKKSAEFEIIEKQSFLDLADLLSDIQVDELFISVGGFLKHYYNPDYMKSSQLHIKTTHKCSNPKLSTIYLMSVHEFEDDSGGGGGGEEDGHENNSCLVLYFVDVSKAIEDASKTKQSVGAQHDYMEELLATVSHEIKNLLNGTLQMLDLCDFELREIENLTKLPAVESAATSGVSLSLKYLDLAQKNSQLLLFLVHDISDFSQHSKKKIRLVTEEVNIAGLKLELETLFGEIVKMKGIAFSMVSNVSQPTVSTDGLRLKQVLINLITNAIKYTTQGRVFVEFNPVKDAPHLIKISVADTGHGIPNEVKQQLFELYRTFDHAEGLNPRGVGLGLVISMRIVQAMGPSKQRILISSTEGKGTCFSFFIFSKLHEKQLTHLASEAIVFDSEEGNGEVEVDGDQMDDSISDERSKDNGMPTTPSEQQQFHNYLQRLSSINSCNRLIARGGKRVQTMYKLNSQDDTTTPRYSNMKSTHDITVCPHKKREYEEEEGSYSNRTVNLSIQSNFHPISPHMQQRRLSPFNQASSPLPELSSRYNSISSASSFLDFCEDKGNTAGVAAVSSHSPLFYQRHIKEEYLTIPQPSSRLQTQKGVWTTKLREKKNSNNFNKQGEELNKNFKGRAQEVGLEIGKNWRKSSLSTMSLNNGFPPLPSYLQDDSILMNLAESERLSAPISDDAFAAALKQLNVGFILIVDDTPYNAFALHQTLKFLKKSDFEIVTKHSGSEAVEIAQTHIARREDVALLFIDLEMPNMSGIEAIKIIKATINNIIAIIVSGMTRAEDVRDAKDHGADGYLVKPVRLVDIKKKIASLLRTK